MVAAPPSRNRRQAGFPAQTRYRVDLDSYLTGRRRSGGQGRRRARLRRSPGWRVATRAALAHLDVGLGAKRARTSSASSPEKAVPVRQKAAAGVFDASRFRRLEKSSGRQLVAACKTRWSGSSRLDDDPARISAIPALLGPTRRPDLATRASACSAPRRRFAPSSWSKSSQMTSEAVRARCSTASVPTKRPLRGRSSVAEVTSAAGSPISAANSSATRDTPTRRLFSRVEWHSRQIRGRARSQRGQMSDSPLAASPASRSRSRSAAPQFSHTTRDRRRHRRGGGARPVRFKTATTGLDGSLRRAPRTSSVSAGENSPDRDRRLVGRGSRGAAPGPLDLGGDVMRRQVNRSDRGSA